MHHLGIVLLLKSQLPVASKCFSEASKDYKAFISMQVYDLKIKLILQTKKFKWTRQGQCCIIYKKKKNPVIFDNINT